MPTEAQVIAAVLTAANTALPATVRAYEAGKVPSPRPNEFVVVSIVRRAGGNPRAGRFETTGWSVYVMAASASSEANARNSLRLVGTAIESQSLTVAGERTTPVRFSNGRPVAPDDGYFSGVNTYDFTI